MKKSYNYLFLLVSSLLTGCASYHNNAPVIKTLGATISGIAAGPEAAVMTMDLIGLSAEISEYLYQDRTKRDFCLMVRELQREVSAGRRPVGYFTRRADYELILRLEVDEIPHRIAVDEMVIVSFFEPSRRMELGMPTMIEMKLQDLLVFYRVNSRIIDSLGADATVELLTNHPEWKQWARNEKDLRALPPDPRVVELTQLVEKNTGKAAQIEARAKEMAARLASLPPDKINVRLEVDGYLQALKREMVTLNAASEAGNYLQTRVLRVPQPFKSRHMDNAFNVLITLRAASARYEEVSQELEALARRL